MINQAAVYLGVKEGSLIDKSRACYLAMFGSSRPEARPWAAPAVEETPEVDDGEVAQMIDTQPVGYDTRPLRAALDALAEANEPPWIDSRPKIETHDVEGKSWVSPENQLSITFRHIFGVN